MHTYSINYILDCYTICHVKYDLIENHVVEEPSQFVCVYSLHRYVQ